MKTIEIKTTEQKIPELEVGLSIEEMPNKDIKPANIVSTAWRMLLEEDNNLYHIWKSTGLSGNFQKKQKMSMVVDKFNQQIVLNTEYFLTLTRKFEESSDKRVFFEEKVNEIKQKLKSEILSSFNTILD